MKICAHCTTENRDEAIFCTHCRHPLPIQTSETSSSRKSLVWLLVIFVLLGLSRSLFSSDSSTQQTPSNTPMPDWVLTTVPVATRTQEPRTLRACVTDTTKIRRGPGTQFETIGGLLFRTCLTILGRNEAGSWVYIVSDDHQTGWVAVSLLGGVGGISKVSVRDDFAWANTGRATLTSAEIAYGAQAYLTQVSATNVPGAPLTQYMVPCFETASRVGYYTSCRMEKAVCDYLPELDGSPTFCNDRPSPDHNFALIVFGEDWSHYDGQCIIVSGYLEIAKGVLKIEALSHDQVSYCY